MSIIGAISGLFGSASAQPIEAVGNVLDKLFTSDGEKLDKQILMQRIAQQPALLQAEISKVQAQHRSKFVAGARPFILWVCGIGLLFPFVFNPVFQWVTGYTGPELPLKYLIDLVYAILGLGGFRTVEKLKGRAA